MKKTFSNRYIFIYSGVLVVVAALILTVVAVSLKPAQEKNQQAETKQMILKTIGIESTRDNAAELYAKHITEADGYYTFSGGIIIPLHGTGLWGPIWGYLALDAESTVVGAVFDHKGETPGLGGEIASDKFAARFIGKRMDAEPIHLKKNADPANPYEVDAISGGTMTSNGVTAMLQQAYEQFKGYGLKFKEATQPEVSDTLNLKP
ncbi:MAG: FMN-binding protein [Bacteroidales bacterium]|nr:FMN-binding protein [Bacteroidales bacterium]